MLDCPLASDLVSRLRADRSTCETEMPWWFYRCELWLADLREGRRHDADNDDCRAAIAARCEEEQR